MFTRDQFLLTEGVTKMEVPLWCDVRGDSYELCTLHVRILPPRVAPSSLRYARSYGVRARAHSLASLRSSSARRKTHPFPYRFKTAGGAGGSRKNVKGNGWFCLPPLQPPKSSIRLKALRAISHTSLFYGFASARGFATEHVVACTSAHCTQALRIKHSPSLALPAWRLRSLTDFD